MQHEKGTFFNDAIAIVEDGLYRDWGIISKEPARRVSNVRSMNNARIFSSEQHYNSMKNEGN